MSKRKPNPPPQPAEPDKFDPILPTHAALLAGRRNVPGLGPSDCTGELVPHASGLGDDQHTMVHVYRCPRCDARIAFETRTDTVLNVYRPPSQVAGTLPTEPTASVPGDRSVAEPRSIG